MEILRSVSDWGLGEGTHGYCSAVQVLDFGSGPMRNRSNPSESAQEQRCPVRQGFSVPAGAARESLRDFEGSQCCQPAYAHGLKVLNGRDRKQTLDPLHSGSNGETTA